jgi:hypothetical protein
VPVGDVLVGDAGCDIEHDDTTLAIDVVTVTKTSKLLLSCGIPDIELDVAQVLGALAAVIILEDYIGRTVLNPRG